MVWVLFTEGETELDGVPVKWGVPNLYHYSSQKVPTYCWNLGCSSRAPSQTSVNTYRTCAHSFVILSFCSASLRRPSHRPSHLFNTYPHTSFVNGSSCLRGPRYIRLRNPSQLPTAFSPTPPQNSFTRPCAFVAEKKAEIIYTTV